MGEGVAQPAAVAEHASPLPRQAFLSFARNSSSTTSYSRFPPKYTPKSQTDRHDDQNVKQAAGARHASRVPGSLPSEAGPARGHQGGQAGPGPEEADPGPPEEGRDAKSLPKGQDAAVQAGAGAADGPDGRHGGAVGGADPGQQCHEPHDAHDGVEQQGHERGAEEHES